jgi:tRNA A37 threonylcarbamoyladenosine dehydratase
LPVIAVGGAGGKRDGTAVRITDLAFTVQDEMLRQVRRMLRYDFGFPKEPDQAFGVTAVYSPEKPMYPWADGTCSLQREPDGESMTLDCASGFGSATFVTGAFGFAAAGEVVRRIANG